jgi:2'-5' RNA ligase
VIKRCIMIFPKFDNIEVIHELRSEFDPLYKHVAPHITLVFPFDSEITTLELKEHLHKSIKGFIEFNLQLQGIYGGKGNYLFLDVTLGREFLIGLQSRIYNGILKQYIPKFLDLNTYIPHLTVGRIADQTKFNAALNRCRSIDDIFIDTIKSISVEIIDDNENSIIELTIDIGDFNQ